MKIAILALFGVAVALPAALSESSLPTGNVNQTCVQEYQNKTRPLTVKEAGTPPYGNVNQICLLDEPSQQNKTRPLTVGEAGTPPYDNVNQTLIQRASNQNKTKPLTVREVRNGNKTNHETPNARPNHDKDPPSTNPLSLFDTTESDRDDHADLASDSNPYENTTISNNRVTFEWMHRWNSSDTAGWRGLAHQGCYNLDVLNHKFSFDALERVGVKGGSCIFFTKLDCRGNRSDRISGQNIYFDDTCPEVKWSHAATSVRCCSVDAKEEWCHAGDFELKQC